RPSHAPPRFGLPGTFRPERRGGVAPARGRPAGPRAPGVDLTPPENPPPPPPAAPAGGPASPPPPAPATPHHPPAATPPARPPAPEARRPRRRGRQDSRALRAVRRAADPGRDDHQVVGHLGAGEDLAEFGHELPFL